jgi:hypothetical protein
MDHVLRKVAIDSRVENQRKGNPPGVVVHPSTSLQEKIVNSGMQKVVKSSDAAKAAKLARAMHPEDIDEELASWL